ncbi:hypothetical protein C4577_01960 [Candidatus Parcubacteria bacterium]|nr:MAG: hypothetical protein C4577_01960 [Candidatus Parcubacteria bacterium]
MTKEEARIILLEDALRQAQHTVEFLHNCLLYPSDHHMNGGYNYAYPEQTLKHLEDWNKLAPKEIFCNHSRYEESCKSCVDRVNEYKRLIEAKEIIDDCY